MLIDVEYRGDILKGYCQDYVEHEEAKCFFKLGDIVLVNKEVTQVTGICTGGIAFARGSLEQLRTSRDAKLLWRAINENA